MKELEVWLDRYINRTVVTDSGDVYFIKELMGKVRNMKIEMYFNDHSPPHFHVNSDCGSINAVFGLYDCSLIKGQIDSKDRKRVEVFYEQTKNKLIAHWDQKVINHR